METVIRDIIHKHGNIATPAAEIRAEDDLFGLGLSSFACVQLMIAVEERFDIEFPDALMNRATFQTMAAIEAHVRTLQAVSI